MAEDLQDNDLQDSSLGGLLGEETFEMLFKESLSTIDMVPGAIVTGTIVDIDKDYVTVHAGLKSEGVIPRGQFLNEDGEFGLEVGDQVKVAMETVDDGFGETRLSREKARRADHGKCWSPPSRTTT